MGIYTAFTRNSGIYSATDFNQDDRTNVSSLKGRGRSWQSHRIDKQLRKPSQVGVIDLDLIPLWGLIDTEKALSRGPNQSTA